MSIEKDREYLINSVRRAVALQTPEVENDPAYTFSDEDIYDIIKLCIPNHNIDYTVENFPPNQYYMLLMLVREEMYWILATSSAKFYPLEAEGASLRKDYRFKHYSQLIKLLESKYASAYAKFQLENPTQIKEGTLIVDNKHYSKRQMDIQQLPEVTIELADVTANKVDFMWDKFNSVGGIFDHYEVYFSTSLIYDEFEGTIKGNKVASITNIRANKLRVKDLKPNTHYYILVKSLDVNGLYCLGQTDFTTKEEELHEAK